MSNTKNLRQAMPQTAGFIDAMRAAFGADQIDTSIRAGMKGGTAFYASENSHEIGRNDERVGIPLSQCVLKRNDASNEAASAKNARRGK